MEATINLEMSNFPVHLLNGHQNFINQVNDAIDRHIDDPELSISGLAQELKMSRATLFRKLKAKTGKSPSAHICSRRLSLGRLMLIQTDLTISDIAYSLGFNSPSYFTRKFSEYYQQSPREFRSESGSD